MYYMYLKKIMVPVMPEKIKMQFPNRNETIDLANDGEVNLLKSPGLTEIEFELLIPNVQLPFANYKNGFKRAYYYLEYIERLKTSGKAFSFIIYRYIPTLENSLRMDGEKTLNKKGQNMYQMAMKVTLEEYEVTEAAEEGYDCKISIKLKQWKEFGTKTVKLKKTGSGTTVVAKRMRESLREIKLPTTHKVSKNDTIWIIAKKYYNDELKYIPIWKANRKKLKLKSPEDIKPGMKLRIPHPNTNIVSAERKKSK